MTDDTQVSALATALGTVDVPSTLASLAIVISDLDEMRRGAEEMSAELATQLEAAHAEIDRRQTSLRNTYDRWGKLLGIEGTANAASIDAAIVKLVSG